MRKISAKHAQWLEKELSVLESAGVISAETSGNIRTYYTDHTESGLHWAIIAFAVLGSLLIGAGIILLIAHNWDELGRTTRTILSFVPLIGGILLSTVALVRNGGTALRESAGIFHSISVGASIALIGQTYHIPSDTPVFLLSWSLLILPLSFMLGSTGSFLVYLGLISGWSAAAQTEYGHAIGFWLLLAPALARVMDLIRIRRDAPDTLLSLFGILIVLCISTGIVLERTVPGLWIVAYSAMLSASALLGMRLYGDRDGWSNPLKTVGSIGLAILVYILTWPDAWHYIGWNHIRHGWIYQAWGPWLDGATTLAFIAGWLAAALKSSFRNSLEAIFIAICPVLSIACFAISSVSGGETKALAATVFNLFLFLFGLLYLVLGCRNIKLRQLNGGMAILSILLITRFFDSDFGFLVRGIVFIALGICFLVANLAMARRKKSMESVR